MPNDCPNNEVSADYRMAVFVTENLYPHVVSIHNNDDSLWVKITKEVCGEKEDIYIGTVYFRPYKNNNANLQIKL